MAAPFPAAFPATQEEKDAGTYPRFAPADTVDWSLLADDIVNAPRFWVIHVLVMLHNTDSGHRLLVREVQTPPVPVNAVTLPCTIPVEDANNSYHLAEGTTYQFQREIAACIAPFG